MCCDRPTLRPISESVEKFFDCTYYFPDSFSNVYVKKRILLSDSVLVSSFPEIGITVVLFESKMFTGNVNGSLNFKFVRTKDLSSEISKINVSV